MLGAERAADAGEGDVEASAASFDDAARAAVTVCTSVGFVDCSPRLSDLEFVDPLADFALGFFRGGLQPEIVDLR